MVGSKFYHSPLSYQSSHCSYIAIELNVPENVRIFWVCFTVKLFEVLRRLQSAVETGQAM
jgi:hypothetical protein